MLEPPVIIVGAPRSGTTWLGHSLSKAICFAYSVEPRPIWEYGNWFKPDDVLVRADLRPPVAAYIRNRFEQFVQSSRGHRLLEKTPNNCFRIDFVDAVFPQAIFVFVTRDPRTQVESLRAMQEKGPTWQRILERLEDAKHPGAWPALITRLPWLLDRQRGKKVKSWGVRPPDWRTMIDLDEYPLVQWTAAMHWATQSLRRIPSQRVLRWKYEELVARPTQHIEELARLINEDLSDAAVFAESQRREIRTVSDADLPSFTAKMLLRIGYEV